MPKPVKKYRRFRQGTPSQSRNERNQPFDLLLTRYALERLLYRLSVSKHRERFVLKGAVLMTSWMDDPHRPMRDLDLLGFGDADPDAMIAAFRDICAVTVADAVSFDVAGLTVDRIRDEAEYGGLRLKTTATIDGARVRVIVDVGFGDVDILNQPTWEESRSQSLAPEHHGRRIDVSAIRRRETSMFNRDLKVSVIANQAAHWPAGIHCEYQLVCVHHRDAVEAGYLPPSHPGVAHPARRRLFEIRQSG